MTPRYLWRGTCAIAVAALAATPLTASATPLDQTTRPPSDRVTIKMGTVNGTGCPPGTATVALNPDNTAVTVTYSKFQAESGPGLDIGDGRKACQMSFTLNVPEGYTYAVAKADYRGFARLATGATGTQRASYYFQGESDTRFRASGPLRGPYDGDYAFTDEVDLKDQVYAPCGAERYFNIKSELRLDRGSSTQHSFMSVDSADLSFATKLHFSWKRCR